MSVICIPACDRCDSLDVTKCITCVFGSHYRKTIDDNCDCLDGYY